MLNLSLFIAGLLGSSASSADIVATKNIVTYKVTLDSITPKYLLTGSGKKAVVEFTVTPSDKSKFAPHSVTLSIDGSPIEVTGVDVQGTYTVELIEGTDLPRIKSYEILIDVDNAQSEIRSAVVYDFSGKITRAARFSFEGRSDTRLGIDEAIGLEADIRPIGVTAADIGGLSWDWVGSGNFADSNNGDGSATFDAGDTPGSAVFNLRLISGPSLGATRTTNQDIIAPNAGKLIRAPGSGIYHTAGTVSCGFLATPYVLPSDVSFANVSMREGYTLPSVASGSFTVVSSSPHFATAVWFGLGNCSVANGCEVLLSPTHPYDQITTGDFPLPFTPGTFIWPIPWEYMAGAVGPVNFATVEHRATGDANGRCCQSKDGQGPYCVDANAATFMTGYVF